MWICVSSIRSKYLWEALQYSLKIFFKLRGYVCRLVHTSVGAYDDQGYRFLGAGVAGSHELSNVGAEN